ncbi:unnamed protein product [Euphydryas editha]|uniref:Uncharacterized protein n=1 Tax=Euphydryas editha TaxID=104508 RepID=A0AAU9TMD9_EUPED|nr:unnamed protein product [Euphydryas editha]
MECFKCKSVLGKKAQHFVCQGPCGGTFHKKCVKGLASDLKRGISRIHCNNCEGGASEDDDLEEDTQDFSNILKDIQNKVGAIPGVKKQLEIITESLSLLSDKYDTLIVEHEQSKDEIKQLERKMESITNKYVYI